jgi:hypothetical protein
MQRVFKRNNKASGLRDVTLRCGAQPWSFVQRMRFWLCGRADCWLVGTGPRLRSRHAGAGGSAWVRTDSLWKGYMGKLLQGRGCPAAALALLAARPLSHPARSTLLFRRRRRRRTQRGAVAGKASVLSLPHPRGHPGEANTRPMPFRRPAALTTRHSTSPLSRHSPNKNSLMCASRVWQQGPRPWVTAQKRIPDPRPGRSPIRSRFTI